MSDEIQIINEGADTVVAVTLLTKPDEGGGFDAAALAEVMHAATAKSTPADNDAVAIVDSAASNGLKKTLWSAIKATLKTYFDTIYTNTSAVATQISNAITALGLGDAATKNVGTTSGTVAAGDDSRFSDARTPTAHKSTHATGGADALSAADIGAATSAQGTKADTAVQPNTSPTFAGVTCAGTIGGGDPGVGWYNISPTSWFIGQGYVHKFAIQTNRGNTGFKPTPVLASDIQLGWIDGTAANGGTMDLGIERDSTQCLGVTTGTAGARGDLKARDLVATQYFRPASYTVSAANALVGTPDGARIQVSNDANGSIPAFYQSGTGWLRYDGTAIST